MIKIFYKTLFSILIIILLIIFYLTIFGLETKKFNHLISNNLEKKHENLSIELNRVYLKLFPFELSGHYNVDGYKKVAETIYKFTKD